MSAGWLAQLTASAFNRLGQYVSSPGNTAYCYAELTVSSLAMAVTIASTHCVYSALYKYSYLLTYLLTKGWPG